MFRIFHKQPECFVKRCKEEKLMIAGMSMAEVISSTLKRHDYSNEQKLERIEKAIINYEKVKNRINLP